MLVLTDHPDPKLILLTYSPNGDTPELTEKWTCSLHDRVARPAEYLNDIIVHPAGRVAIVSCYTGKLKVLTFEGGDVDKNFDVMCVYPIYFCISRLKTSYSLPEFNLLSLCFLYTEPNDTLALIHIDHKQRIQLLARSLDVESMDLSVEVCYTIPHTILPLNHFPFTETPLKLISVPPFSLVQSPEDESEEDRPANCRGGVLILGGRKVNFYELSDKKTIRDLKNKDKRQTKRRASGNVDAVRLANEKDAARELKKVKPRATVKWPWGEVSA